MERVLVVDDELEVGKALRRLLRRDYEVQVCTDPHEALALVPGFQPDVVLSDFRMPGMNGAELLARVRQLSPLSLRIVISAFADLNAVLTSVNEGEVCHFVKKPWDDAQLLALLERMLASRAMLAMLYQPFRAEAPGRDTTACQTDSALTVKVGLSGQPFPAEQAVNIVSRFASTLEAEAVKLVGGLLERRHGRITFAAEVGGDQHLTIELPVEASREPTE